MKYQLKLNGYIYTLTDSEYERIKTLAENVRNVMDSLTVDQQVFISHCNKDDCLGELLTDDEDLMNQIWDDLYLNVIH